MYFSFVVSRRWCWKRILYFFPILLHHGQCLKSCVFALASSTSSSHSSCIGVTLQGWQKSSSRQVENDASSIAHDWIYHTCSALFKGTIAEHDKLYWLTQYSSIIISRPGYSYESPLDSTMQLFLLDKTYYISYLLYNKTLGPSLLHTNFIGSFAWPDSFILKVTKMSSVRMRRAGLGWNGREMLVPCSCTCCKMKQALLSYSSGIWQSFLVLFKQPRLHWCEARLWSIRRQRVLKGPLLNISFAFQALNSAWTFTCNSSLGLD